MFDFDRPSGWVSGWLHHNAEDVHAVWVGPLFTLFFISFLLFSGLRSILRCVLSFLFSCSPGQKGNKRKKREFESCALSLYAPLRKLRAEMDLAVVASSKFHQTPTHKLDRNRSTG